MLSGHPDYEPWTQPHGVILGDLSLDIHHTQVFEIQILHHQPSLGRLKQLLRGHHV